MLATTPRAPARRKASSARTGAFHIEAIETALNEYGQRGVFKGVSRGVTRAGQTKFRILWHYGLVFELMFNEKAKTLSFVMILPKVPVRSAMYKSYKGFVEAFNTKKVPDHRRIDVKKAAFKTTNSRGNASLSVVVKKNEYEYAVRKLVHVVQEIFLVFLWDGPYFEYRVEHFHLNPDIT